MVESLGERITGAVAVLTFGLGTTALFAGVDQWYMIFVVGWFLVVPLLGVLLDGIGSSSSVGDAVVDEVERSIEEEIRGAVSGRGTDRADAGEDAVDPEDALDVLRERYARGELDEAEFERKVERLLETERIEDAETLLGGGRDDREFETERS